MICSLNGDTQTSPNTVGRGFTPAAKTMDAREDNWCRLYKRTVEVGVPRNARSKFWGFPWTPVPTIVLFVHFKK